MDDKKQLVDLVMESDLVGGLKDALVQYIYNSESANDQLREDVATVFEIYADVEQSMADNTKGLATLEEQVLDRLKMIDAEEGKRLSAVVSEFGPKVKELNAQVQDLMSEAGSGGAANTAQENTQGSEVAGGDLPPLTTSSY